MRGFTSRLLPNALAWRWTPDGEQVNDGEPLRHLVRARQQVWELRSLRGWP
jgi:hypothetical protein